MKKVVNKLKNFLISTRIITITVLYSIRAIAGMVLSNDNRVFHPIARRWSKAILNAAGVELNIYGQEKLDKNQTYIYVTNHSSLFDIPIVIASLNDNVRIMYKRELEKYPVFGYSLKRSPFIPVTRSNPKNAMGSIQEAIDIIKANESVIMFPEGTRSKDGKLGNFKRGAFMLASRSCKPIVPVAIIGSASILPSGSLFLNKGKISVIIDNPITNDAELSRNEENDLMNFVHERISDMLTANYNC